MINDPRHLLTELFMTAVRTADPMKVVSQHLPPKPNGRLIIIGAGKASARMAEAVEAHYGKCEGLVITRYGYERPTIGIEIASAAHPVPDQAGVDATNQMLSLVSDLNEDDQVIALISGGGSALLCAPKDGLSLTKKQEVNSALLASGARISEMNILRKHLSKVKGGQLARACYPARLLSLVISDVPGDDMAEIASGPTLGTNSPQVEALRIRQKYLPEFEDIDQIITSDESLVPLGDPKLSRTKNVIIAAPSQSLTSAANIAREMGIDVQILGDAIEGEARDVARKQAEMAITLQSQITSPTILLSGGELTVTRRGEGIGGPNAEYALAMAVVLNGHAGIFALAGDTDGVDGAAEVAGAYIDPDTLRRASHLDLASQDELDENNAHRYFESLSDQIITGPTLTNVNDFRAVLIIPTASV